MKTIILYMSKDGTTKKVAKMLTELLMSDVEMINLRKNPNPDISYADMIVIGGSIHMGMIQKRIRKYCEKNEDVLIAKPLGLFICCMEKGETAQHQLANAFPKHLRLHAKAIAMPGGELLMGKMNFIEKVMVKKVVPDTWSCHSIKKEAVTIFAQELQN